MFGYRNCTKAIIGLKNGFFGQIKKLDLKFPVIHCIIYQEVLWESYEIMYRNADCYKNY